GVHESEDGSYRAPDDGAWQQRNPTPPQTIIPRPLHVCDCISRGSGAPVSETPAHESFAGSYRAPVFVYPPSVSCPPHALLSPPVQTEGWRVRPVGAPESEVGVHASSAGS